MAITFAAKRKDPSKQFSCRLPVDVIGLIESGCRETGLSQSKFLTLCIVKHSKDIPDMARTLQRAVWNVLANEAVAATTR